MFNPSAVAQLNDRQRSSICRKASEHDPDLSLLFGNQERDVDKLKVRAGGYRTWTDEEIEQFEKRHRVGTKAQLALALHLFLSQRRSDVVLFGRQHVKDSPMRFTQFKGRNIHPVIAQPADRAQLQEIIDASLCRDLTFLVTEFDKPFTTAMNSVTGATRRPAALLIVRPPQGRRAPSRRARRDGPRDQGCHRPPDAQRSRPLHRGGTPEATG
jgi:hypothetical protein